METKLCKICGRELPLEMFDEGRHQCKDCRRAYRKQRRLEHPEIHRAHATRRQNRQGEWLNSIKLLVLSVEKQSLFVLTFIISIQ